LRDESRTSIWVGSALRKALLCPPGEKKFNAQKPYVCHKWGLFTEACSARFTNARHNTEQWHMDTAPLGPQRFATHRRPQLRGLLSSLRCLEEQHRISREAVPVHCHVQPARSGKRRRDQTIAEGMGRGLRSLRVSFGCQHTRSKANQPPPPLRFEGGGWDHQEAMAWA